MSRLLSIALLAALCLSAPLAAEEGMWEIEALDAGLLAQMRGLGLELSQEQIFSSDGGIARAVVGLGGASGSFVSPHGLILTNHHVAFGAIQRASTPEHNYLADGFYADRPEREARALGYEARVLISIEDVTPRIMRAARGKSGAGRFKAIEQEIQKITQEAERDRDVRVSVAAFYGGLYYRLFTYFVIRDVRLVYAPPGSIGNYGGDIDNWMWPRHTGDFAFLRAYVARDGSSADYSEENVPYEPLVYLPLSSSGVRDGDFTMIIGFPGQTQRHRSSHAIDLAQNWRFPERIRIFSDLLEIFTRASEGDPAVAIKLARFDAMLNNAMKNYEGQLEGFARAGLLERKLDDERRFEEWVRSDRARARRYGDVLGTIGSLYAAQERIRDKQQVLGLLGFLHQMTGAAGTIYRWSEEKTKRDLDRDPAFMERNIPRMRERLGLIDRSYDEEVDRRVMRYFVELADELPQGQRIRALDALLADIGAGQRGERIETLIDRLYGGTNLGAADERLRMFDLGRGELMGEGDAFIKFYARLYPEIKELEDLEKAFDGDVSAARPRLIEALREKKGGAFYPDANGTMRLTYGTVKGYRPRDAVWYDALTVLGGAVEKHTGAEPFDCPPKLLELARRGDFGAYADESLGDVPIAFLSTCDITGGNSGSPIINGRGECIGTAFDGNWESISADFLYNEELTRAISVESRYILFVLDRFSGAYELLGELTIR